MVVWTFSRDPTDDLHTYLLCREIASRGSIHNTMPYSLIHCENITCCLKA